MKSVSRLFLINLFCFTALPAAADDPSTQFNQQTSTNTQTLVQYLQNLGGFLGYDLTQSPTANNQTISQQLLNAPVTQVFQSYVYSTFFGALPVNTYTQALSQFIPTSAKGADIINPRANITFSYQNYSSDSQGQGGFNVSDLIDQKTYQQDPVSQAVLNILTTPDYTYCMDYELTTFNNSCDYLYQNLVISNVIGDIPNPQKVPFFSYQQNQQLIGQLNSNSLIAPLLYSTDSPGQGTGSPTPPGQQSPGLVAQTQVEEAANFIRYASGQVAPGTLPSLQSYTTLYQTAYPPGKTTLTEAQQKQAQVTLATYLANLRIFAAQSSVGIGNLYYILSKRLPQKLGSNSDNSPILSSEAMSEFRMASWRLFNSDFSQNKQWINQINNASSATVQKEIATLLAEINYQMYLDRQLQERILLTNSIMLIQNTRSGQPSADLGGSGGNSGGGTGGSGGSQ